MNKGFTMVETVLVLSILSIMLCFVPPMMKSKSSLKFACERLKDILWQEKSLAIANKEERIVNIQSSYAVLKDATIKIGEQVFCDEYQVIFNPRGNVDSAGTIRCYKYDMLQEIVVNLGSGNIYVH